MERTATRCSFVERTRSAGTAVKTRPAFPRQFDEKIQLFDNYADYFSGWLLARSIM